MIELLVVIVIIGILTSVSIFALAGSRETSRDARRKADLEKIRSALELYKADNGCYPPYCDDTEPPEICCDTSRGAIHYISGSCPNCGTAITGSDWESVDPGTPASVNLIRPALVPKYMDALPIDPINDADYYYSYEPTCNQNSNICGSVVSCVGKGCCAYSLRAAKLEDGTVMYEACDPLTVH